MASMSVLECVVCPLCGSEDYTNVYVGKDYLFSQERFTIVRCKSCGLVYTNPRVIENKISYYYYPDYSPFEEVKQSCLFQKAKSRLGRLFGNIHWEVLQMLQSINAKTILEIGPGNGSLLYFLKDHGFDVIGVETDSGCVQRIQEQGIPCHYGDLNDVISKIGAKKFDAVILCHVFEHLYHPRKALENVYGLLNENGIVYLSLPNSKSKEAKLFGKYWRGYDLPRHIIHYDDHTIRAVLTEAGFDIVELGSENFPSSFVESIAFLFFNNGRMPYKLYYLIYYPWKLLGSILTRIIGSGVMTVVAKKAQKDTM